MSRGVRTTLHQVDLAAFRRVQRTSTPRLDVVMPRLTHAADHGRLWFAIALALGTAGDRFGRRAALRGLLALGVTSAVANGPLKWWARLTRPALADVPVLRQIKSTPWTTSFPSGHSASAAAFATGAALERPDLAIPLGALAAGVGYSRVHVGVHYPGDVLAGAAIGAGVAIATRRFWPVAPHEAAAVRRHAAAHADVALPTGDGLSIALNPDAGPALSSTPGERLQAALPQVDLVEVRDGGQLPEVLAKAATGARAIGVVGGDGSVNCAARVAVEAQLPLVVVPGGTLNHFARDVGVLDLDDAVGAVTRGEVASVDVATIAGQVFVNTASFGSYAELVDARERLESSVGKWPAVAVALWRVLRHSTPVEVELDGRHRRIWMIFIGNCRYHPSGFAPSWRERLDDGQLDVRVVDAGSPFARTRLLVSVLTGRLGRSRVYEQRLTRELRVRSRQGPLRLARDGETFDGPEEFTVAKSTTPLLVYAPADA